jgi:CO/xanthine dehydrogenase Mo-binding subunit
MNSGNHRPVGLSYYSGNYTETVRAFAKATHVTQVRLADSFFDVAEAARRFDCELALGKDGSFLAIRLRGFMGLTGHLTDDGLHRAAVEFARSLTLIYRVPVVEVSSKTVGTDAQSPDASGEDASSLVERLIDQAAREIKIDPVDLRKRNFANPGSGVLLDMIALEADIAHSAERKATSLARGKLNGHGIAFHREMIDRSTSVHPPGPHIAEVEIDPETGRVDVVRYTTTAGFGLAEAGKVFEEGGAGALPAMTNAVVDAIGRHIEMPATPERVRRVIQTPLMLGLYDQFHRL